MSAQDDPQYFKEYLRNHPKDKFAWYLLGKQYLVRGEEGKAAYCFVQSGEVYDAFEGKGRSGNERMRKAIKSVRTDITWRRAWQKAAAIAVVSLALLLIPSGQRAAEPKAPSLPAAGWTETIEEPFAFSSAFAFYYMPVQASHPMLTEGLFKMIGERREPDKHQVLLTGEQSADGKWNMWLNKSKLLLSVQPGSRSRSVITYYDGQTCSCMPEETSIYEPYIEEWKREQEEAAVLRSAVSAFQSLFGSKPQNVEQLYKPYPNNVIGGVTPFMREVFEMDRMEATKTGEPAVDEKPEGDPGAGVITAILTPTTADRSQFVRSPLIEPLTIVVDKAKHRLALVSGNLIVRSYPIGLGGDKTPEGEFFISEKVRDPNGKTDGDFGSRGMTLSGTQYAIHGTNKPESVGKDESLGCIRMSQADVEELFDMVPLQTKVKVGVNVLPDVSGQEILDTPSKPFTLPAQTEERNPNKVYRWL